MSDTYRRVVAYCKCCGKCHTEVPATAKRTVLSGTTYWWWDCDCGSGQAAIEGEDRVIKTPSEAIFYFAKAGVAS
jgi:hypothetical protein